MKEAYIINKVQTLRLAQYFRRWDRRHMNRKSIKSMVEMMKAWRKYFILNKYFTCLVDRRRDLGFQAAALRRAEVHILQQQSKRLRNAINIFKVLIIRRKIVVIGAWTIWKARYLALKWLRKFAYFRLRDAFRRLKRRSKWPLIIAFSSKHTYQRFLAKLSVNRKRGQFLTSLAEKAKAHCYLRYRLWLRKLLARTKVTSSIKKAVSLHRSSKAKKFFNGLVQLLYYRRLQVYPEHWDQLLNSEDLTKSSSSLSTAIAEVYHYRMRTIDKVMGYLSAFKAHRIRLVIRQLQQRKHSKRLMCQAITHHNHQLKCDSFQRLLKKISLAADRKSSMTSAVKVSRYRQLRRAILRWTLYRYDRTSLSYRYKKVALFGRSTEKQRRFLSCLQSNVARSRLLKSAFHKGFALGYDKTYLARWRRYHRNRVLSRGKSIDLRETWSSLSSLVMNTHHFRLRQAFHRFLVKMKQTMCIKQSSENIFLKAVAYHQKTVSQYAMLVWRYHSLAKRIRRWRCQQHLLLRGMLRWIRYTQSTITRRLSISRAILRSNINTCRTSIKHWFQKAHHQRSLRLAYGVYRKLHPLPLLATFRRIFIVWSNCHRIRAARLSLILSYYEKTRIRRLWERWETKLFDCRRLRHALRRFQSKQLASRSKWQHIQLRYGYRSSILWQMSSDELRSSQARLQGIDAVGLCDPVRTSFRRFLDRVIDKAVSLQSFMSAALHRRLFKHWSEGARLQRLQRLAYKHALEKVFNRTVAFRRSLNERKLRCLAQSFVKWKTMLSARKDRLRMIQIRHLGRRYLSKWINAHADIMVRKHIYRKVSKPKAQQPSITIAASSMVDPDGKDFLHATRILSPGYGDRSRSQSVTSMPTGTSGMASTKTKDSSFMRLNRRHELSMSLSLDLSQQLSRFSKGIVLADTDDHSAAKRNTRLLNHSKDSSRMPQKHEMTVESKKIPMPEEKHRLSSSLRQRVVAGKTNHAEGSSSPKAVSSMTDTSSETSYSAIYRRRQVLSRHQSFS
jgi:hypothetical protein